MTINLWLHCGADYVERNAIENVVTPMGTDTFQPIPHIDLVAEVERQLTTVGFGVTGQAFGLTHDGMRMFGVMELTNPADDYAFTVGFRNAHDKRFAAAMCFGAACFVCDNMAFTGETHLSRKHTAHIGRDLPKLVHDAVRKLDGFTHRISAQYDAYKSTDLNDMQAQSLIVDAVQHDVIGAAQLNDVVKEWHDPTHDEFSASNVWRLFNAVTEVSKRFKFETQVRRTQNLHALCDAACGFNQPANKGVIDSYAIAH